jgi:hypothetical protein
VAHSLGAAAVAIALRKGMPARCLVFVGAPLQPLDWVHAFARRLGLGPAVMDRMRQRSQRRIDFDWDDLVVRPPAGSPPPPLLVVHDRDDREVPWEDGAGIAAGWPGARLLTTSGLGHRRILRAPAVLAAVAEFVAEDRPASDPVVATACTHDRASRGGLCQDCALEADLFAPDRRRLDPSVA